jgi:hypothetical protein
MHLNKKMGFPRLFLLAKVTVYDINSLSYDNKPIDQERMILMTQLLNNTTLSFEVTENVKIRELGVYPKSSMSYFINDLSKDVKNDFHPLFTKFNFIGNTLEIELCEKGVNYRNVVEVRRLQFKSDAREVLESIECALKVFFEDGVARNYLSHYGYAVTIDNRFNRLFIKQ